MRSISAQTTLNYSHQPGIRGHWLSELAQLIEFPTISADPRHRPDLEAAAYWLKNHLTSIGLQHAQILAGPNGGAPSVYADWLHAPAKPTLLLYGHFDVQPPNPLSEWRTPPFRATIQGQNLFGRGASDDKGQFFIHLKALESYLKTQNSLPLNVKVWLEGEEEINSPNLPALLEREGSRLKAEAILVSDTNMLGPSRPSIIYGLRGNLSCELEVRGPSHDLHSGRYGGAVLNPLQALCEIIAGLHDREGRITIPGFYNRVRGTHRGSCQPIHCGSISDSQILTDLDLPQGWGEKGYSLFERMTSRPALTLNGLRGGYSGPGSKAVIPARGLARLSIRLVPGQEPAEIAKLLQRYIQKITPPAVTTHLKFSGSTHPVLIPIYNPVVAAATRAVQRVWGVPPVFTRSGGTIGVVSELYRRYKVPIILLGFGMADDDIHAPNEKFSLPNFFKGVETIINFLAEYAR